MVKRFDVFVSIFAILITFFSTGWVQLAAGVKPETLPSIIGEVNSPSNNLDNSISGRVTDQSGNGIVGATIYAISNLYQVYLPHTTLRTTAPDSMNSAQPDSGSFLYSETNAATNYSAITDSNGYYSFPSLPANRYRLTPEKSGYSFQPVSRLITLPPDGTDQNFLGTAVNRAPNSPYNPSPADESLGVSITQTSVSWIGGDPDGDSVTYDVYFDTVNPPTTLAADDQPGLSYSPGLDVNTTYFWKVTAKDEHGLETSGPVWRFTTTSSSAPGGMVTVPAGNFTRGCVVEHNGGYACRPDELPSATIYLDAFTIDVTEVTNAQYALCVTAGNCTAPGSNESYTRPSYYSNPTYASYPVLRVNWYQANAYCAWAGKRLPTEAEWEKAARGSTDARAFPWGDSAPTCSLANHEPGIECVGDTSAVGSYPAGASPYGALDMAGNVYEWVNDWNSDSYYSIAPNINPTGPATGIYKVMRGGSAESESVYLRLVYRDWYEPDYKGLIGFRCASSLP